MFAFGDANVIDFATAAAADASGSCASGGTGDGALFCGTYGNRTATALVSAATAPFDAQGVVPRSSLSFEKRIRLFFFLFFL